MRLFLCEKPSQAGDIAPHVGARRRADGYFEGDFQGERVVVTYAIGHLMELVYPDAYDPALKQWSLDSLPFIPEPTKWRMEAKTSTLKQFKTATGLLKQASSLVIATDADREGELIAYELIEATEYVGKTQRLWLGALDDASIKKALSNLLPAAKTIGMAHAGKARSHADWAVGLNMTRALTVAFGAGGKDNVLNCGRVQTPVMALVVKRERAIVNFKATSYYELAVQFDMAGTVVPMRWTMPFALAQQQGDFAGALDASNRVIRRAVINAVADKVRGKTGRILSVTKSAQKEVAPLLYCLSTLQQEASRRFGLKPAQVLDICQSLYEKHKATTYPRTDCEYLPQSMQSEIPAVLDALSSASGVDALMDGFSKLIAIARKNASTVTNLRAFNTKKITAHHAIIPTMKQGVNVSSMSTNEAKLYDLIRRRYVAQLLGDYQFEQTDIAVICEAENFTARGAVPISPGWKLCYPVQAKQAALESNEEDDESDTKKRSDETVLPAVREGMQAHNRSAEVRDCLTKPPKRYTEGTLLGAMESIDKEIEDPRFKQVMRNKEKAGIGTDATRASIIQGLFDNKFLEHHPKLKKQIVPSTKANEFVAILEQVAPSVTDPVLTALWEEQFSAIENGALTLAQFEGAISQWVSQCVAQIKLKTKDGLKVTGLQQGGTRSTTGAASRGASKNASKSDTVSKASNSTLAAGMPCPECKNGTLSLTPSSKYRGKYLLVCGARPCNFFTWPKS